MAKLLKESDLFVVQLQDSIHSTYKDDVVSVTFDTLKDSIVDLAIPGTRDGGYSDGKAGVVYPGQGFYYDESDGRLDVRVDSDLQFVGVIETDSSTDSGFTEYDASYATATGDPVVSRGNFYIVGESNIQLDPTVWFPVSGSDPLPTPNLGDLVICVDDSVAGSLEGDPNSHAWNVIPNVTGGQAVLEIRASAPNVDLLQNGDLLKNKERYVDINTTAPIGSSQRPVVRVRRAGFIPVTSDSISGGYYVGGLIDEFDKEKLDKFDLNLYEGGFVRSLNLRDEKTTTDSLLLAEVGVGNFDQYPALVLSSKPATEYSYGVVELATQPHVFEAVIGGYGKLPGDSVSGMIDSVVMTPLTTINNFVPRLFNTLPNLETASTTYGS
jgi:hypothetical protein